MRGPFVRSGAGDAPGRARGARKWRQPVALTRAARGTAGPAGASGPPGVSTPGAGE
jgi:hypothetical protein